MGQPILAVTDTRLVTLKAFDSLVCEVYGRPYSLQQQDGCVGRGTRAFTAPAKDPYDYERDEIPEEINGDEMGVSFNAWLERDPNAPVGHEVESWAIELFWHRNFYPSLDMVVNDLHKRGCITAGEYAINIDW